MHVEADIAQICSDLAKKVRQQTANKYAPTLAEKVVKLGSSSIDAMQALVNEGDCSSNDHKNISAAALTWSDIIGLTQRHASATSITNNAPTVTGFAFKKPQALIEAEIVEEK